MKGEGMDVHQALGAHGSRGSSCCCWERATTLPNDPFVLLNMHWKKRFRKRECNILMIYSHILELGSSRAGV
jgi:hypothetical protein